MTREPVVCPLCDGHRFQVYLEPSVLVSDPALLYGAASGLRGTQRLVRCTTCDLIYENPRFPESVILAGYTGADDDGHDSQFEVRVRSFEKAMRSLGARIPQPPARVLDIGTAGAAFLKAAGNLGYQGFGLEPSRVLVQNARRRGLEVVRGTLDDHVLPKASFDLVCLWDVLEHVIRPRDALVAAGELLRPEGVLLVNYPDIGTLQARLAGPRFWWLLSVHTQHFDRRTIRNILQRTGFDAFHFQRYWQTLEFGYLEAIAGKIGVPGANFIARVTPESIRRLPLPYYASQTTVLAKKSA